MSPSSRAACSPHAKRSRPAAFAGSATVGLAYGWFAMLSRMTIDLLVHPLLVAGLVWLFTKLRSRGKGEAGPN